MLTMSTYCKVNSRPRHVYSTRHFHAERFPLPLSASLGQKGSKHHPYTCQAVYKDVHDLLPHCHHMCPSKECLLHSIGPYRNIAKLLGA